MWPRGTGLLKALLLCYRVSVGQNLLKFVEPPDATQAGKYTALSTGKHTHAHARTHKHTMFSIVSEEALQMLLQR